MFVYFLFALNRIFKNLLISATDEKNKLNHLAFRLNFSRKSLVFSQHTTIYKQIRYNNEKML